MLRIFYTLLRFKHTLTFMLLGASVSVLSSTSAHMTMAHDLPPIDFKPYVEPDISPVNEFDWVAADKKAETLCLAKNIYFEGRGESTQGQLAIGLVTINRVMDARFPNEVCDVVMQKGRDRYTDKLVAQFSWTLDGNSNYPKKSKLWYKILRLAQAMTADGTLNNFNDITNGALYYHATRIDPNWHNLKCIKDIEHHRFYTA